VSEPSIIVPRRRVLDPAARRQRAEASKARQRTRRRLFNHFLDNGFADDDELAFFLDEFLGLNYPRVAACPHHVAPFQILSDLYFDRMRAMLIFASRASGKTLTFAVMNLLDGSFRPEGIDITNAAASRDQAVKCYRYFLGFHKDPLLASLLAKEPTQSYSEYKTGSTVEVVTGSIKGLNCVTGDTKIDCPRDLRQYPEGIPIQELVGKTFVTYAWDEPRKTFVLARAHHVRKTLQHAPLLEITYKWGCRPVKYGRIRVTSEHPFKLLDGRWVLAGHLAVGDRLRAIHRVWRTIKRTGRTYASIGTRKSDYRD
jgi:hypothetical protein